MVKNTIKPERKIETGVVVALPLPFALGTMQNSVHVADHPPTHLVLERILAMVVCSVSMAQCVDVIPAFESL